MGNGEEGDSKKDDGKKASDKEGNGKKDDGKKASDEEGNGKKDAGKKDNGKKGNGEEGDSKKDVGKKASDEEGNRKKDDVKKDNGKKDDGEEDTAFEEAFILAGLQQQVRKTHRQGTPLAKSKGKQEVPSDDDDDVQVLEETPGSSSVSSRNKGRKRTRTNRFIPATASTSNQPIQVQVNPDGMTAMLYNQVVHDLGNMVGEKKYWPKHSPYFSGKGSAKARSNLKLDLQESMQMMLKRPVEGFARAKIDGGKSPASLLIGGRIHEDPADLQNTVNVVWALAQAFPSARRGWTHDESGESYMQKITIHLEDPTGTHTTTPAPTLWAATDYGFLRAKKAGTAALAKYEKELRATVIVLRQGAAPCLAGGQTPHRPSPGVAKAYDTLLGHLLLAKSKMPPPAGGKEGVTDTTYDFDFVFSTAGIPDHVDEPDHEGCGHFPCNLVLMGSGLMLFSSDHPDAPHDSSLMGINACTNTWTAFTESLRYTATHQVLNYNPTTEPIDFTLSEPQSSLRMVARHGFGEPTSKWLALYRDAYEKSFLDTAVEFTETLTEEETQDTQVKPESKVDRPARPRRAARKAASASSSARADDFPAPNSKYIWDGGAAKLWPDCPNADTLSSLRLRKREDVVLEPGTVFSLWSKSTMHQIDYMVIRVGRILKVSNKSKKEFCYMAWLVNRHANETDARLSAWSVEVLTMEASWILPQADGSPLAQVTFRKATPDELSIAEKRFIQYKRKSGKSQIVRPSQQSRQALLAKNYYGPDEYKALLSAESSYYQHDNNFGTSLEEQDIFDSPRAALRSRSPVMPLATPPLPESSTQLARHAVVPRVPFGVGTGYTPPGVLGQLHVAQLGMASMRATLLTGAEGTKALDDFRAKTAAETKEAQAKHEETLKTMLSKVSEAQNVTIKTLNDQLKTMSGHLSTHSEGLINKALQGQVSSTTSTPSVPLPAQVGTLPAKRGRDEAAPRLTYEQVLRSARIMVTSIAEKKTPLSKLTLKRLMKYCGDDEDTKEELQELYDVLSETVNSGGTLQHEEMTDLVMVHCTHTIVIPNVLHFFYTRSTPISGALSGLTSCEQAPRCNSCGPQRRARLSTCVW